MFIVEKRQRISTFCEAGTLKTPKTLKQTYKKERRKEKKKRETIFVGTGKFEYGPPDSMANVITAMLRCGGRKANWIVKYINDLFIA